MPTPTYEPLANVTLGSNTTTVTFSSISQAYRDLILVADCRTTGIAFSGVRFNNDTSGSYSWVSIGPGLDWGTGGQRLGWTPTTYMDTTKWSIAVHLMDYSTSGTQKTGLFKSSNYASTVSQAGWRWANTAAISTITLWGNNQPFAAGSTFALYGVVA